MIGIELTKFVRLRSIACNEPKKYVQQKKFGDKMKLKQPRLKQLNFDKVILYEMLKKILFSYANLSAYNFIKTIKIPHVFSNHQLQ